MFIKQFFFFALLFGDFIYILALNKTLMNKLNAERSTQCLRKLYSESTLVTQQQKITSVLAALRAQYIITVATDFKLGEIDPETFTLCVSEKFLTTDLRFIRLISDGSYKTYYVKTSPDNV